MMARKSRRFICPSIVSGFLFGAIIWKLPNRTRLLSIEIGLGDNVNVVPIIPTSTAVSAKARLPSTDKFWKEPVAAIFPFRAPDSCAMPGVNSALTGVSGSPGNSTFNSSGRSGSVSV